MRIGEPESRSRRAEGGTRPLEAGEPDFAAENVPPELDFTPRDHPGESDGETPPPRCLSPSRRKFHIPGEEADRTSPPETMELLDPGVGGGALGNGGDLGELEVAELAESGERALRGELADGIPVLDGELEPSAGDAPAFAPGVPLDPLTKGEPLDEDDEDDDEGPSPINFLAAGESDAAAGLAVGALG